MINQKKLIIPDDIFKEAFEKIIQRSKNPERYRRIFQLFVDKEGIVSRDEIVKTIYQHMYGEDYDFSSIWEDTQSAFARKNLLEMDKYLRHLKCRIRFVRGRKNVPAKVCIERLSGYLKLKEGL